MELKENGWKSQTRLWSGEREPGSRGGAARRLHDAAYALYHFAQIFALDSLSKTNKVETMHYRLQSIRINEGVCSLSREELSLVFTLMVSAVS